MRHFRAIAPDDAAPEYRGLSFDYADDAFKVGIGKLVTEFEAVIVCNGDIDGQFYAERVVLLDAYNNQQTFTRGGSSPCPWLHDAAFKAVDAIWPTIFAWLVEKAEEER